MKASVIIAARDAENFISSAVSSALNQSLRDLEVIVVDDGSTDGTADVISALQRSDKRVVLRQNAVARGVSAARNIGISISKGEWIAVLDADDVFDSERLSVLISEAERRRLDLLADNLLLREMYSDRPDRIAYPDEWMLDVRLLTVSDFLQRDRPSSKYQSFGYIKPVISKQFLNDVGLRYDESVWCAEDFLLYTTAILLGGRFGTTDEALYTAYLRPGSLSADRPALHQEVSRVNQLLGGLVTVDELELLKEVKSRQLELDYFAMRKSLKAGDPITAARMALRISPSLYLKKARKFLPI